MQGRNNIYAAAVIFSMIFGLANSGLHPVSSNAGYTGAPGDSNCASCHNGSNSSLDGNINISGLPSTIITNQTYRITITMANPNGIAAKAGFQLVALTGTNTNAGNMENNTQNTEIRTVFGGKKYFGHSPAVSFPVSKVLTYSVDWKAPGATGSNPIIKFYASGVIANGDNATSNDRVVLSIRQISIQNSAPLSVNISNVIGTTCSDSSNGSATVTASGGTGQYSYVWSNGITSETNATLPAGLASVTITDNGGATSIATVNIPAPPILSIAATGSLVCDTINKGKMSVTASGGSGGYTFLWSNGVTENVASEVVVGQYKVTVTDQNKCSRIAETNVRLSPQVTINENKINPACHGENSGSISLVVSGGLPGYSYSWSNNKTESEINNLSAGSYTITIIDGASCSTVKSIEITEPKAINGAISFQKDVSCYGQKNGSVTIEADGGSPEYLFNWSNGSFNSGKSSSINNLEAGNYKVTISDLLDCSSTVYVTVTQPPLIALDGLTKNVSCFGLGDGSISAIPTGSMGQFSYVWSTSSASSTVNNLVAGLYTVTVTDTLKGCSASRYFEIKQPQQLKVLSALKNDVTCHSGKDGKIEISADGGIEPLTYLWTNGSTNSSLLGLGAGIYSYSVSDKNGCSLSGEVSVLQPPQIKIVLDSVRNATCAEIGNGYLAVSILNTSGAYKALWSNGIDSLVNTTLFEGKYRITVTDINKCVQVDTFIMKANPGFFIELSALEDPKCNGDSTGFAFILPDESLRYEWSNGSFGPSLNRVPSGSYSVTATDRIGCKSIPVNFKILQPPLIKVELLSSDTMICPGSDDGFIKLKVQGGTDSLSTKWSHGKSSLAVDSLTAGQYTVTITDKNNCKVLLSYKVSATDTIKITQKNIIDVNCSANDNASINLTVKGGVGPLTYKWSKPGLQGNSVSELVKGLYKLTITDMLNCSIVDSFFIDQLDSLSVSPMVTNETIAGKKDGKVSLNITGGKGPYLVHWSNGGTGTNLEKIAPGYHTYIIEDVNKCQKNGYIIVGGGLCLLSATATTKPASCFNSYDGKIELKVQGVFSGYFVELSSSSGPVNLPLDSLPPGKYAVAVIDSLDCLAIIYQVEVGTINPPIILQNIIKTNPTSSILKNGSMEALAIGGKGTLKYEWYKDGQKIGNDKKLESLSIGIYSLIIMDSSGCSLKINSIFLQTASSSDDDVSASIRVFPNPASEFIHIENKTGLPIESLTIYNNLGHEVYHQIGNNVTSKINIKLYLSDIYNTGLYFLKMKIGRKNITKKIIITN